MEKSPSTVEQSPFVKDRFRTTMNFQADAALIDKLKSEWKEFVSQIKSSPCHFEGRGIVICAGGLKYFTCAWVNINMLRMHGCTLPIEIWHTDGELPTEAIEALNGLNVKCKNAMDYPVDYATNAITGYALKPLAIINSEFKEVLFLDADNNCVVDPTYLFDSEQFQKYGTVFWPDYWLTDSSNPIWKVIGSEDYNLIEQESGQILINKEKCWKELNLCMYFNVRSEYYYKMLVGDKDTFKFAWKALGSEYYMINTLAGDCGYLDSKRGHFRSLSLAQHDFNGNIVFLHRNSLKWDITLDGELVWREVRCYKGSYTTHDSGDVEFVNFEELFGDLEMKCLDILSKLRQSDLYARFMMLTYFRFFRPKEVPPPQPVGL